MIIEAQSLIAKTWKQPMCLSTVEWIKKMWYAVCCLITQLCPTLCNPMDCSPPGSSVHKISQASILEQVAISFSSSSQPRDWTWVSWVSPEDGFFPRWALGELDKEGVVYTHTHTHTHTHTREYYSAIKKNEIMPFAATWMSLEIIIPSEVMNLTVIKRERKGEEGII